MPGFTAFAAYALLLVQPATLLTDPDRAEHPAAAEYNWTLRLAAEPAPGKADVRGLIALARPCSNWVDALRTRSPSAAQGLFELCVERAMDDDFDGVAVLAHSVPAVAMDEDTAKLAAVMRIELDCVGQVARDFDPLEQEDFRESTNSWHVAQRKVSLTKRCLAERLKSAGLDRFAAYHYSRRREQPRNH